jgi:hypothetical protein
MILSLFINPEQANTLQSSLVQKTAAKPTGALR